MTEATLPRASTGPRVRNVKFALEDGLRPRYWYQGRRAVTIFFNNLSIFFPEGEAFFIRSVRHHAHLVKDPHLASDVRAFCAQEGIHTREHIRYNEMLRAQGYRVEELEARVERLLGLVTRVVPRRWQLAATACLEHFTATMGHVLLGEERTLAGADPVMAALWRWHAAEEYEHKAVAWDVYQLAGGNYVERSAIMLVTTALFWAKVVEQQAALMRDDGIAFDAREWADLAHQLFVEPGVMRHVVRAWAEWFKPGFHPHDIEGLEPLHRWIEDFDGAEYQEARQAATARRKYTQGVMTAKEPATAKDPASDVLDVAIVGAGFSGLGMAMRLRKEGLRSFVVLEKGAEVGGTWRENTYPGCACDVPSHLYSFSFEPEARWTRRFSPQPEILDYLKGCADKYGLRPQIRLNTAVRGASFDDARGLWRVRTCAGEPVLARHLALGIGALHRPSIPAIPGAERFRGRTFHSAEWDHGYDLRGKRVAVIGTGASAIQFVPRIAPLVSRLDLYQRTPPWVMPIRDRGFGPWEKRLFEAVPLARKAYRAWTYALMESKVGGFTKRPELMNALAWIGRLHIRLRVKDPALRAKLTPSYLPGCKRILISNDYYPALNRENVSLVTEGIREIGERGVVTQDGREREVDAIIYGTGFKVAEPPPRGLIVGRGGKDLADAWGERIEAYLGTTVAGFPNLYHLMGPNTGLGHNSMVFMIEAQIDHVLDLMRAADRRGAAAVEVRAEAQRRYNDALAPRLDGTVWGAGCKSWYLDPKGQNSTTWPGSTVEFWWRTRRLAEADYEFSPPASLG